MIRATIPTSVNFENYQVSIQAGTLPITLDDVKTHLKEYGTDNNAELTRLISVATEIGERITGRDFINKTYIAYLNSFPCSSSIRLKIRKSKLQSITSIEYYSNSSLETWDSVQYSNTNSPYYSEVFANSNYTYPVNDNRPQAVKITFVSGYGSSADDVPIGIKQGLYMLVANLFENKGDCSCVEKLANNVLSQYILPSALL